MGISVAHECCIPAHATQAGTYSLAGTFQTEHSALLEFGRGRGAGECRTGERECRVIGEVNVQVIEFVPAKKMGAQGGQVK